MSKALSVVCPTCKAAVGRECTKGFFPLQRPHDERVALATEFEPPLIPQFYAIEEQEAAEKAYIEDAKRFSDSVHILCRRADAAPPPPSVVKALAESYANQRLHYTWWKNHAEKLQKQLDAARTDKLREAPTVKLKAVKVN